MVYATDIVLDTVIAAEAEILEPSVAVGIALVSTDPLEAEAALVDVSISKGITLTAPLLAAEAASLLMILSLA
jgi:hypothetical protein